MLIQDMNYNPELFDFSQLNEEFYEELADELLLFYANFSPAFRRPEQHFSLGRMPYSELHIRAYTPQCGIPQDISFKTKNEIAFDLISEHLKNDCFQFQVDWC